MESMVPPESEWNAVDQDFEVWDLGDTASPAYAMIVPGWVRLAVAGVDPAATPDWDTAKEQLEDVLRHETPPPGGWTVVPVLEHEAEAVEIGPNTPRVPSAAEGGKRDTQVWRVNCQGDMAAWLIAYKDTSDATLVLPNSRASNPAWRSVARGVARQILLKEFNPRSPWRLAIVGEERQSEYHIDPQAAPLTVAPSTPGSTQTAGSSTRGGILSYVQRRPLITVLLILVLCVAISFVAGRLRQATSVIPGLSVTGTADPAIKTGARAVVVSSTMVPVRTTPGNKGDVLMLTAAGQTVDVTGGPQSIDNQVWRQVKIGNNTGWLPEKLLDGTQVLAPVP